MCSSDLELFDNPSGVPAPHVMGSIAGLFVPDDLRQLPTIDPQHPAYKADAAWMARIKNATAGGMDGMEHRH